MDNAEAVAVQSASWGMGTELTHRIFGKYAHEALRAVEAEAARLEKLLSRFIRTSEISKINSSAGLSREKLSPETYGLLARAAQISRQCHGCFDITVGPLVDLWDYKHSSEAPDQARISRILPLVNHAGLLLDPGEQTAKLQQTGQSIDVGGIGKGYASDKFLEVCRGFGVTSAFTNLGGNVATLGTKPDGSPWSVGIRHPRQENRLIGAVAVADKAVVTSGDYQRYFIDPNGKRQHHILDPHTGYPAESGLISVTIVADNAMDADAWSTLLFVAGIEQGLKLLKNCKGAESVLVDTDLQVYVTGGLKDSFRSAGGIEVKIID